MPDVVSPEVRSRMMAGIGPANTKPEMIIRRGLHALGYRYTLHDRTLPGRPDLKFTSRRAVIFVNGCFWHGHDCQLFRWPEGNAEFWRAKIESNRARDRRAAEALAREGWRQLTVWECALRGRNRIGSEAVIVAAADWLQHASTSADIRGIQS